MTEYDYEAEVVTDDFMLTFRGNDPKTVSAQGSRMLSLVGLYDGPR